MKKMLSAVWFFSKPAAACATLLLVFLNRAVFAQRPNEPIVLTAGDTAFEK